MRAAIAIDNWKLPIFERHLSEAGYTFEKGKGLTADTMFLYVETEHGKALELVVRAANAEAAKRKLN